MESFVYALHQRYPSSELWACQIGRECAMPGLYAMVGAAAVLGGVTRYATSFIYARIKTFHCTCNLWLNQ